MTIFGITLSAAVIWLIIAVICAAIEAITMGLTTIWFTGGAIAAAIVAMLGFSVPVQAGLCLVVSILLIYFTRPIAVKKLKVGKEKTNVDALAGREALVTETIQPFRAGQAKVDGLVWSAVAKDEHSTIESGSIVKIDGVEGVKLIVSSF